MAGQVGCAECHVGIGKGHDPAALRNACVECHDEKYRAMADAWQGELGKRAREEAAAVAAAEGARSVPMRMLIKAKGDVSMVVEDRSKGAHNPAFARMLLDAAARLLKGEGEKDAPGR
jgi:ribosomal protein S11